MKHYCTGSITIMGCVSLFLSCLSACSPRADIAGAQTQRANGQSISGQCAAEFVQYEPEVWAGLSSVEDVARYVAETSPQLLAEPRRFTWDGNEWSVTLYCEWNFLAVPYVEKQPPRGKHGIRVVSFLMRSKQWHGYLAVHVDKWRLEYQTEPLKLAVKPDGLPNRLPSEARLALRSAAKSALFSREKKLYDAAEAATEELPATQDEKHGEVGWKKGNTAVTVTVASHREGRYPSSGTEQHVVNIAIVERDAQGRVLRELEVRDGKHTFIQHGPTWLNNP